MRPPEWGREGTEACGAACAAVAGSQQRPRDYAGSSAESPSAGRGSFFCSSCALAARRALDRRRIVSFESRGSSAFAEPSCRPATFDARSSPIPAPPFSVSRERPDRSSMPSSVPSPVPGPENRAGSSGCHRPLLQAETRPPCAGAERGAECPQGSFRSDAYCYIRGRHVGELMRGQKRKGRSRGLLRGRKTGDGRRPAKGYTARFPVQGSFCLNRFAASGRTWRGRHRGLAEPCAAG